jgi:hypothetical protein
MKTILRFIEAAFALFLSGLRYGKDGCFEVAVGQLGARPTTAGRIPSAADPAARRSAHVATAA